MAFAANCRLVRRSRLTSDFCSTAHASAPPFFQGCLLTIPLRFPHPSPPSGWIRDSNSQAAIPRAVNIEVSWGAVGVSPSSCTHITRRAHAAPLAGSQFVRRKVSDRRLISHENGDVTFRARTGTTTGGDDRCEPLTLPGPEFVRRWSLHILPKNYTKTRRFGGCSNRHCKRSIEECRTLLLKAGIPPTSTAVPSSMPDADSSATSNEGRTGQRTEPSCPACGSLMQCIAVEDRTSWRIVMHSPSRPGWHTDA